MTAEAMPARNDDQKKLNQMRRKLKHAMNRSQHKVDSNNQYKITKSMKAGHVRGGHSFH